MTARESRPENELETASVESGGSASIVGQVRGWGWQCSSCRRFGLIYPDGGRRCSLHASDADALLLDALDTRGRAIGLPKDGLEERHWWPYGPNVDVGTRVRMLDWAEANSLTYADRAHRCISWVRDGRCSLLCDRHLHQPHWMDHVTCWKRDGDPAVLVAQPYQLGERDGIQLGELAADPALRLELSETGAWYGEGLWFIGVWRVSA